MKKYSLLLFDLDHTLWDFETNSHETLEVLFEQYELTNKGIPSFKFFFETFTRINLHLWDLYDRNLIGQDVIRSQRFHKVFMDAGLDDYLLSLKFSNEYLLELPKRKNLLPHAKEILDHLYTKYPIVIVTNGFDEMQETKMRSGGINHYFKSIVTSQRAGDKKPSKKIFDFTLEEAGHAHDSAIMIGDNLQTDIVGARMAGIDTVYFNPSGKPHAEVLTHEIKSLKELLLIL
ncbi:YjjG family noncanonical pyrimidine nucleotidase [soil metagenome]